MKQSKDSNPTIIARETLRQLAALKIPPTPDNYLKLYHQISGDSGNSGDSVASTVTGSLKPESNPVSESVAWGDTLEALLKQLENKQGTLTIAKKREGVKRVLAKFSKDSEQLHNKLKALVDSWGESNVAPTELIESGLPENSSSQTSRLDTLDAQDEQAVSGQREKVNQFSDQLRELVSEMLEQIVAKRMDDANLADEAKALAHQLRSTRNESEMRGFIEIFRNFNSKFADSDQNRDGLQQGLLRLLTMLMDSTGEILAEDQWIGIRIGQLRETIAKPLNSEVIEQAERYLEEITQRQEIVKSSLNEAKLTLKKMVTSLITNIEELTDTTDGYQEKLGQYVDKISKTDDIKELNQLLAMIMDETRQMQKSTSNYRNDFLAARAEVSLAQSKINQLETELQVMGEKVHEDHLTGILNRRGLDSAFEREAARSARHQVPLCFALLDIDNFKQLNDTHGHKVGDDALVYLVESVKDTTRPEDVVSRYGGEEFVILLPNTNLEEGVQILSRIRRNLTKKFFLHENKRLLITFSAGVAQFRSGESQESIFKRADEALYRAKKGGKNQILTSE
ncbi:GGDEF domain-containing protein [Nitrosomonas sp. sh817]|uniref:GGDEF domain-containing protein n=1 Tax=Nitrosomonas sp. sh817 TaxID=3070658 RepID=UPI0027DDF735|nr:GGDEF domain-containing protein [Nitrosomonas sp. sh817]WMJ09786.1 diguanylate cyclase [Nitrosomonas sp. sh817]